MLIIFYIIILIIIIYYFFYKYINNKLIKYNRLKILNINKKIILGDVIKQLNIIYTDKKKWDIYIPYSYTYLEKELNNLVITDRNQKIFGINYSDFLAGKNHLWINIYRTYGRKIAKKYLPNTYILKSSKDINLFKKDFSPKNVYLLKKNIQKKKGIMITNDFNTILNSSSRGYVVIQELIKNLYLINNRKINLRLYLLIICKNKKIYWYLNSLGKCIYTNKDFNKNNINEPEIHLTSLNLDNKIYLKNPMTLLELKYYLGKKNYFKLFNNIIKILSLCKYAYRKILRPKSKFKNNTMFQLFGVDFIFDKNFKPYLLEFNKGPQMKYINSKEKQFKTKIFMDIFNILGLKNYVKHSNNFIQIE